MRAGARRQVVAIALGLALFGAGREVALWALVLAYVGALCVLELTRLERGLSGLTRSAFVALCVVLSAPGLALLASAHEGLAEVEGLSGLTARLGARLDAQAEPSIAPPLVAADRPQTFVVRAQPAAKVLVRLAPQGRALAGEEMGAGLYRIAYDPRRDGAPTPSDDALRVTISVNGDSSERTLRSASPLAHPRWLTASPEGRLAATVSEETDELVVVSARGLERRIAVGDGPVDCAFVNEHELAVSHRYERALWIVDATSGSRVAAIDVGDAQGRLAVSPDGRVLAMARGVASPELRIVDVARRSAGARLALDRPADWLAFGKDAASLVVSVRGDASLRAYDVRDDGVRERARLGLGRGAVTLARSRDGARVFVATTDHRPDGSPNLGNHFVDDQLLTVRLDPLRVTHALHTARRTPRQSKPGDVDRGVSPMGIFERVDGSLLVTFAGSEELWLLRDGEPEPRVVELGEAGLYAPHGVVELADGTLVVSSPAAGALGITPSVDTEPRLLRLAPDEAYLRRRAPNVLARRLGERAFYEATRSGISCQSCHMHADTDDAAHNLGTHHALPTLSVRGLLGTSPYLRDGSFTRVADLDHVAQTLYRGYLRKAPGRASTLEAFVLALPRSESQAEHDPTRRARERRGAEVFVRAGCASCHAGAALTHLGQHLSSELFPSHPAASSNDLLDVPSLLSVGITPPYLSDGRARTLEDVLVTHNRDNRHGDTTRLSTAERRDLITFLGAL